MAGEPFAVDLADGRRLEGWTAGETDAPAVLLHMGTPSAGVPFAPIVDATTARGARFVTYSRPGYAGSTRHEGRSVGDCAADTAAILEHLSVTRAHTVGWSGGGPHALACAARLPDLVRSAATLAGVAPWDADGLAWLDGMAQENLDEFGAALEGAEALLGFLGPMVVAAAFALSGSSLTVGASQPVVLVAFALIGLEVGLRFTPASLRRAGALLPAAVLMILALLAACAGLGIALASLADVSRLDGYLATTPGGLSAVLAVAVGSKTNTTFILSVQLIRTFVMLLAAPPLAHWIARRWGRSPASDAGVL